MVTNIGLSYGFEPGCFDGIVAIVLWEGIKKSALCTSIVSIVEGFDE